MFEHALEHTHGDDLARLLWLKSPSSEVWFDRRTNYTRSLAVMSMVGYILGLGDRHPSNLMLDRLSGKILHIDFGDCFEVAMTREKFPEKIPFRLTRMLINAMEVTGIEGTYRRTCESVMSVLHRNKDSLMAVLEAFVYDPLLNWRLMDNAVPKVKRSDAQGMSVSSSQEHGDMLDSLTATLPKKGVPCSIENGGESCAFLGNQTAHDRREINRRREIRLRIHRNKEIKSVTLIDKDRSDIGKVPISKSTTIKRIFIVNFEVYLFEIEFPDRRISFVHSFRGVYFTRRSQVTIINQKR